jgi:hypothetical protein
LNFKDGTLTEAVALEVVSPAAFNEALSQVLFKAGLLSCLL